tara:strand:- start:30289 stop:30441 length:153 start_codon:yes stop_codon:yes gene_type:complete
MELISTNDSSEKIISILAIGFLTLSILLVLNLIKVNKLKSKIKQLENDKI